MEDAVTKTAEDDNCRKTQVDLFIRESHISHEVILPKNSLASSSERRADSFFCNDSA